MNFKILGFKDNQAEQKTRFDLEDTVQRPFIMYAAIESFYNMKVAFHKAMLSNHDLWMEAQLLPGTAQVDISKEIKLETKPKELYKKKLEEAFEQRNPNAKTYQLKPKKDWYEKERD